MHCCGEIAHQRPISQSEETMCIAPWDQQDLATSWIEFNSIGLIERGGIKPHIHNHIKDPAR